MSTVTTRPNVVIDTRISSAHTRTFCVDCGTSIDSVPRGVYNALEAARSASSNRDVKSLQIVY